MGLLTGGCVTVPGSTQGPQGNPVNGSPKVSSCWRTWQSAGLTEWDKSHSTSLKGIWWFSFKMALCILSSRELLFPLFSHAQPFRNLPPGVSVVSECLSTGSQISTFFAFPPSCPLHWELLLGLLSFKQSSWKTQFKMSLLVSTWALLFIQMETQHLFSEAPWPRNKDGSLLLPCGL